MLPPLVIRPSCRVICLDLIDLFQLPTPLTSEVDKKRRNPHLAFPSLNKCNVVRATAAAIARGKRNVESVLPSQRSTEIRGRSSQQAVLTVSPNFHLGRCELPLGITRIIPTLAKSGRRATAIAALVLPIKRWRWR
jgi:hypothetical protein